MTERPYLNTAESRYDLPIHPAYACSMEGTIDRKDLRVGGLGGSRGQRFGRAEWERRYYGAEMRRIEAGR